MNKAGGFDKAGSLDAKREQWLRAVKLRAAAALESALQAEGSLQAAVGQVHTMATENMAMIERNAEMRRKRGERLPVIACKKGCDACCHLRVQASTPEVLNIAEHVKAHFSEDDQQALKARLRQYVLDTTGLSREQKLNKMLPCPLLVDHACSAHSVRPLHCRAHHSVDVLVCQQGLLNPNKVKIPHYLEVPTVIAPLSEGIESAIQARKLGRSHVALVAGLLLALETEDIRARWLAGQNPFDGVEG